MAEGIIKGAFWSAVHRFGGLVISFISNIVLARLLCPNDFGIVGMVMVFVSIADVLVDGGLGNAIIQKKEVTKNDLSTVCFTNLILSVFLFLLFFFSAPFIESYSKVENLALFLRVESIMILLRAFYVVPYALIVRSLNFKSLAIINIISSSLALVVAICTAIYGLGVWSIMIRNLTLDFTLLVLYLIVSKYRYSFIFDKISFKLLFKFGIFEVLSNLLESGYSNAISFLIGKNFTVKELGLYNQAQSLQQIPVFSLTSVLNQVLFPHFSASQEDNLRIRSILKSAISLITFFIFPVLCFLIVFAEQIITLLYSEKWIECVPYFQLLCIMGFFNALIHMNRTVLRSKGFTKVIFYIQLICSLLGIILLLVGLKYSMIYSIMALVVSNFVLYLITSYISGKFLGYGVAMQFKDYIINLFVSIISVFVCFIIFKNISWPFIIQLVMEVVCYLVIYILIHVLLKSYAVREFFKIVINTKL